MQAAASCFLSTLSVIEKLSNHLPSFSQNVFCVLFHRLTCEIALFFKKIAGRYPEMEIGEASPKLLSITITSTLTVHYSILMCPTFCVNTVCLGFPQQVLLAKLFLFLSCDAHRQEICFLLTTKKRGCHEMINVFDDPCLCIINDFT